MQMYHGMERFLSTVSIFPCHSACYHSVLLHQGEHLGSSREFFRRTVDVGPRIYRGDEWRIYYFHLH